MSLKSLKLLLADGDEGRPVLRQGRPPRPRLSPGRVAKESPDEETTEDGQTCPPEGFHDDPDRLHAKGGSPSTSFHGEPDHLYGQGWGLVVPQGPDGDKLLAWIDPLLRARQKAQGGAPVRVERAPAKLDGPLAARWKRHVFRNDERDQAAQPRYLLLLGDLDKLPLEVQQVLSTDSFVGRLAFRTEAEYAAYVAKVLRWESARVTGERGRLLFYTARDDTPETDDGYKALMVPNIDACRRSRDFSTMEIRDLNDKGRASMEQLLMHAAVPRPAVLFSLSHGLRASKEQRSHQGALMLPDERILTAADVAARPFLPGGIWFSFACFSAGVPAKSSYERWLKILESVEPDAAKAVASTLPAEGATPFIAALPQAVLANPEGPLAVIGHVDLAWSYSFKDRERRMGLSYQCVLKALAAGSRVGVALGALQRELADTSLELLMLYEQRQSLGDLSGEWLKRTKEEAALWMQHQDLANFILLGDPAVRLPIEQSLID